jgi:peptidoglycan/xylan/chitin deacetylase (PgdA/CDA1 family)
MAARQSAIVTYHSLDMSGSVISTEPEHFRQQMLTLQRSGVPVMDLASAVRTPGAVALTFDDGFHNFLTQAFPVLQDFGFPATVFVVSGHCGGWNDWPDRGRHIPRLPLMSWEQLREVQQAGIELGAHTVHHRDLVGLLETDAVREVDECRQEMEDRLGTAPRFLAYPYGAVDARVSAMASARFSGAFGTRLSMIGPGSERYALPRIDAYYLRGRWFERLARGGGRRYLALRRILRELRACVSR